MKKLIGLLLLAIIIPGFANSQDILSLDDCIATALKHNSQLNNVRYSLGVQKANKLGSFNRILPNLSASAYSQQSRTSISTYLRPIQIEDPVSGETKIVQREVTNDAMERNFHGGNINWNQTIFDGGAWWNSIRRGNKGIEGAEHNVNSAILNTIALVQQRYLQLLQEIEQLEVFEKSVQSAQEQLNRSETMYRIGSVAQADVYRSRVNLGTEKISYIRQKNMIETAKANLNVAMGRNPSEPVAIDENAFDNTNPNEFTFSLGETINRTLSVNPELKGLETNVESGEMAVKIAKAARIPSLGGRISYSRSNSVFDRVYGDFNKNYAWTFSGQVSYTIFDGFQTRSNIRREQENVLISRENHENRKRTLASDVTQAYNSYKANQEIMVLNEENIQSAEEDLRLATERYKVGAGTLLETIDSQVSLTRARTMFVRTKYDLFINQMQLKALTGMISEKYLDMAEYKR